MGPQNEERNKIVKKLSLVKLKLKATAIESITLPEYAGNLFRGAFGHAFKQTACFTMEKNCNPCPKKDLCPYYTVFEAQYPETIQQIKRLQSPPKPYIITPPPMHITTVDPGKNLAFELTIIGKAIEYLPYFIFTFKKMASEGIGKTRGRFSIDDIQILSAQTGRYQSIFKPDTKNILTIDPSLHLTLTTTPPQEAISDITLSFQTPVNIVVDKNPKHEMPFQPLFTRLISRLNALSLLYEGSMLLEDPRELIDLAKTIETAENYTSWYQFKKHSGRQKQTYLAGGYLGSVSYQGELTPFIPYLQMGEYVNVGKNTTLGLGKYEMKT